MAIGDPITGADTTTAQSGQMGGIISGEPLNDSLIALEESDSPSAVEAENLKYSGIVTEIKSRFQRSKDKRRQDEMRWLECYRNYRGLYGADVQFTTTEKSRVFLKITKTKVLAAYAQILDVMFAGNRFPIGIEQTREPKGDILESVHYDPAEDKAEQAGAPPASSIISRPELLGPFKSLMERLNGKLREGVGKTPTSATWEPAKIAAGKMEKRIQDQLEESDAGTHLRLLAFELCLFGTGILKGPFAENKEYEKWNGDGQYTPIVEVMPKVTYVSVWNAYPDATAYNIAECDYFIERHKLSRYQLRDLKKRPFFRSESIDKAIMTGPNYHPEFWESILQDNNITVPNEDYEVLEYWGMMDRDTAELAGLEIPAEMQDKEQFQINAWICNDQILRLVFNPFTPQRIPYQASPYELNPYSFFGIGVAENMADTQMVMNGSMRMIIDNAALSGNVIMEVDETNLVPGQTMDIYPGKIFRKTSGQPGQSLYGIKIPNVTNELIILFDKMRQLTDEATSMPSYAHGGTGVTGVGRTAAGMSMLMGAADKTVKAVVRNIDDYIITPLGKGMFAFNMQFKFDPELVGDIEVKATGTESLLRNEVRSQKLMQFFQTVSANPMTAPFAKIDYILRELAKALELDEDMVLNDPREAMIQAEIMKQMNPQGQGGAPNAPNTANPQDPTGNGGGNIQPGMAPNPGQPGFTGAGGGANGGQQPQQQGSSAGAESASA